MIDTKHDTHLFRQVAQDLMRHEGYRKFAYPDPLSPLHKQHPKEKWGYTSAAVILKKLGITKEVAAKSGHPWTVGIGWTHGVTLDSTMEIDTALRKTEGEAREVHGTLLNTLTWYRGASLATKSTLINMAYNLGLKGLLSFKNTLAYMKAGQWDQASANMLKSLWAKQVGGRAVELARRIKTQTIDSAHRAPENI